MQRAVAHGARVSLDMGYIDTKPNSSRPNFKQSFLKPPVISYEYYEASSLYEQYIRDLLYFPEGGKKSNEPRLDVSGSIYLTQICGDGDISSSGREGGYRRTFLESSEWPPVLRRGGLSLNLHTVCPKVP